MEDSEVSRMVARMAGSLGAESYGILPGVAALAESE